jgi:hypothetical protein
LERREKTVRKRRGRMGYQKTGIIKIRTLVDSNIPEVHNLYIKNLAF